MLGLNLELPSMSEVVRERREREREDQRQRRKRATLKRLYEGAQVGRLNGDWTTAPTSGNHDLRQGLRTLRARSRDLARNDPYIKKFLSMVAVNVVGAKGVTLQVKARPPLESETGPVVDEMLNRTVEERWADWCHAEHASASGRYSFCDMQRELMRYLARDGETLVRMMPAANPYGFTLRFYDPNYLDETHADTLPNGSRIIMGVEVDANDRAVAYHLTTPYYDYYPGLNQMRERVRVPASEMLHLFLPTEDASQVRGVPWAHAVMGRLHQLNKYNEAEVVAARLGACKGGFLTPPANDETGGVPVDPDTETQMTVPSFDVEPAMLPVLPTGWGFQEFDPTHPNTGYADFEKAVVRSIASGLLCSYFSLGNNLNDVNYSSARIGLLEERDLWRMLQQWMIEHFCRRVYQAWLRHAMMSGALQITVEDYERVKEGVWQPRGFDWVDPVKDITAAIIAINNGLTTRTAQLAERGEDFEDVVSTLRAEQERLREQGIVLDSTGLSTLAKMASEEETSTPQK